MPIRFACEHCNSVLSVSSRKAGQNVTCPKCRQPTPVPLLETVAAAAKTSERIVPAAEAVTPATSVAPAATPPPAPRITLPAESIAAAKSLPAETPPIEPPHVAPAPVEPSFKIRTAPQSPQEPAFTPPAFFDDPAESSDEVTWVYEDAPASGAPLASAGTIDFDRVSLPRYVLYGQGVLLMTVAIVALTLGIVIGRGSAPREEVQRGAAQPCYLTGVVQQQTRGGRTVADGGAVVIVVPQDQRPQDKAPIEGLRPDDPLPDAAQPSLARIKAIGGDYARADDQGYFKLRVPDHGEYFLLVVSRHVQRPSSRRLDPVHLAQMGRYFLPAPDLVGDREYRWTAESIKRDKQYTITFE